MGLCRKLGAEPLVVLPAPGTKPEQIEYAMDWVRYLNDPPSTEWGQKRADNGHHEPYGVTLFQIDDWRAGLHTAGSLMLFEELSPDLTMTCPALLMRNTTDDPKWTSFIYHDHVSWFPGAGYVVEKLFREHYAERYLTSATGSIRDISDRRQLFDKISTLIPEGWEPGSVDAVATMSADGRRIVIKAVNYRAEGNVLLVRLQGADVPEKAVSTLHTITAGLKDSASLEHPNAIAPVSRSLEYAKEFSVDLEPFTVVVIEIQAY